MEEYELQKQHLARQAGAGPADEKHARQMDSVLKSRDAFIAKRIAGTLQKGEVGLLFLGALHRLDALRSSDIRVETLGDTLQKAVRRPRA
jgi:hypothetical protein